jgi:hypothetical protein
MKRILCLFLVVAPVVAYADKNFTSGKGATWDCKKDPKVNISHGKGVYTFKGACTQINLNGGKSKLTIESVDELNVASAGNTITIGTLGTINLVGANNKVTYKAAKEGDTATVNTVGTGNTIEKIGGAASTGTGSGSAGSGATTTSAPPAGGGTAVDCAKTPSFSYNDNGGTFTFTGTCDKIAINGNDAKLTVEAVKLLSLTGNNITATVTAADTIATPGNHITVTYKKSVTANAKVKVSNPGNNNSVKLVK